MHGDDPELGRAVAVAQPDADGVEELEDVGRHRGTSADRDMGADQPELVAQRAQDEPFGGGVQDCLPDRRREPRARRSAMPSAVSKNAASERTGIEHAGADVARDALPLPWREDTAVDADLAEVRQHRLRPLGEIHHQRRHQRQRQADMLLDRPGRRDVGKMLAARAELQSPSRRIALSSRLACEQHDALGPSRSSRRIETAPRYRRNAPWRPSWQTDRAGWPRRGVPVSTERVVTPQQGMAVGPHASVVPVDDVTAAPAGRSRDLQRLVDLFLVLGEQARPPRNAPACSASPRRSDRDTSETDTAPTPARHIRRRSARGSFSPMMATASPRRRPSSVRPIGQPGHLVVHVAPAEGLPYAERLSGAGRARRHPARRARPEAAAASCRADRAVAASSS